MRPAALAALAGFAVGCSVPELDLSGKQCPCVDGYVCDTASQLCVAGIDGGAGNDGGSTASCLGSSTLNTLAFSDDFHSDFSKWMTTGDGVWGVSNNEASQSMATSGLAIAAPTSLVNLSNYRVEAKLHALSGATNGRVGVGVRQIISTYESLSCSWEPDLGELHIRHTLGSSGDDSNVPAGMAVSIAPTATVTMEVEIAGTQLRCCVREAPTVVLSASLASQATGPPTMWARSRAGAWTDFQVFTQ